MLLLANKKVYQFLTKLQTLGRDISKTATNITKKFSMILIYVKTIRNQNYWYQQKLKNGIIT